MEIKYPHLVVSGIVCALGILVSDIWFLSIVGLLPLFHYISWRSWEKTWGIFKDTSLFGIAYVGTVLIWFWNVLPLDWLGSGPIAGAAVVFFSWGIIALSLGLVFGGFGVIFVLLRSRSMWDVPLFSSLFVIAQYLQMWVFALITWSPESLLGPHFSASFIGYSLASFSPLLQLASLGGIYLLSFTVALLAGFFYFAILYRKSARIYVFTSAIGLILVLTFLDHQHPFVQRAHAPEEQMLNVALVSTNFSPDIPVSEEDRAMRRAAQIGALQAWAKENKTPDLLVFPETADVFPNGAKDVFSFQRNTFGTTSVAIIDSNLATKGVVKVQRMFFWSGPQAILEGTYDKMFLVPQGEYTPWLAETPIQAFDTARDSPDTSLSRTVLARGNSLSIFLLKDTNVGPLFCSDILSPFLYRNLAESGASIFVNASSLTAFHGSSLVDSFVVATAKVRAVENGRFLAIASHGGPASIISDRGTILARSGSREAEVLSYDVPLRFGSTLYVRFGPWILWLSIFIVLLGLAMRRYIR